ncbi:MAG: hypothetical protein ACP5QT_00805 [Brevinematia bacterium]
MRKILVGILMLLFFVRVYPDANLDSFTNDFKDVLNKASEKVSTEIKKHMGFYTGSGNVFPVNTSGFPGIKFGLGGGVVLSSTFFNTMSDTNFLKSDSSSLNAGSINNFSGAVGMFSLQYDMIYGKIGIPLIDLDLGLRIGFLPRIDFSGQGYKIGTDGFHFGLEGRYLLFKDPTGIFKADVRLSGDFDYGSLLLGAKISETAYAGSTIVGTNESTLTFGYQWGGSSLGLKVAARVNIPVVGSIYGGLGANLNFGNVTTKIGVDGSLKAAGSEQSYSIEGESVQPYDLFDLRGFIGLQFFFINVGYEYNIMNQDMAITFYPVSITF